MSPALIVNENFPAPAIRLLRANGVDVLAVQETMPAAPDEAVLAKAGETGRRLVTFDRDYGKLVFPRQCAPPRAILYLRQEPVRVPRTRGDEPSIESKAAPTTLMENLG